MRAMLAAFAVLLMVTAGAAAGQDAADDRPLVTVTPYFGGAFFTTDLNLADKPMFGARFGWQMQRNWRLEGNFGYSDSKRGLDGAEVDLNHYGLDVMYQLRPGRRIDPYLLAGWAQFDYAAHAPDPTRHLNGWEWAVGTNFHLGGDAANNRSLRLEVRDVMIDLSDSFNNGGDKTHSWITTVGLQFGFGKSSRDSDGDGVRDRNDACPGTPIGATVDHNGCPRDSDGDGVHDGLDACPATPPGATVDGAGCPLDSDGDGVYDGLDKCADTPRNLLVDAYGCPIPVAATTVIMFDGGRFTTSRVVFTSGSAELDLRDTEELIEVGRTLVEWPELRVEIGGHTDSSGSAAVNARLSEQRALAVLDYIMGRHPDLDPSRFTIKGYGSSLPIADNATAEGRKVNRRVEFTVLNTEQLRRETETRTLQQR